MSPKDVKNYRYLNVAIARLEKKQDRLRESDGIADRVSGSLAQFPFTQKMIGVNASTNSSEIAKLELEIQSLKDLKKQIIWTATNLEGDDCIIFRESMKGTSQERIAEILGVNQTTVGRRLRKICEEFS